MTCAAILSLEDFRDTQRRAEMRPQVHNRFDQWLNELEDRMQDRSPTVEERTQAIFVLRQEWTPAVTEGVVAYVHGAAVEPRTTPCPRCGQTLSARGPQARTVETLGGAIRLRRPEFSCESCQRGSVPLDTALALTGRRQPSEVQKAAVKLAQALPYETACELCAELTGWPRRAHAAHEITQEVAAGLGVLDVAPTQAESTARIAAVAKGRAWRPIMVLAVDGAPVPTRPETAKGPRPGRQQARATRAPWPGAWREAKGGRCERIDGERIVQVLSWHPVQTDEALATARQQVKTAGLIPEAQVRRCVIADGARWIWKPPHTLCPSAVERLDDDHGRAPLAKVAASPDGAHQDRQDAWYEAARARLCWGDGASVIGGLPRMPPTEAQAATAIAQLIRYLQGHQERLDDRFARKSGYPMGSGGLESANTCICHVRLKRSGAWWYVTPAHQRRA